MIYTVKGVGIVNETEVDVFLELPCFLHDPVNVEAKGMEDPLCSESLLALSRPCLEKAMATHSSTLAWKMPWTEEPGRLQSMRLLRVGHD